MLIQIELRIANPELWENLYWNPQLKLTRPDRLATVLNTIIYKESDDSDLFVYDRQAAQNAMKFNLTYHDKQRLNQFDKRFDSHTRSSSSSSAGNGNHNTNDALQLVRLGSSNDQADVSDEENVFGFEQHTMSRHSAEKFLREMSNNVYLSSDTIEPCPINVHRVKIRKLSMNTKLFSNTVLIRRRSNVHALPLRCNPGDIGDQSKSSPTDRVVPIATTLPNMSNHVGNGIQQIQRNKCRQKKCRHRICRHKKCRKRKH